MGGHNPMGTMHVYSEGTVLQGDTNCYTMDTTHAHTIWAQRTAHKQCTVPVPFCAHQCMGTQLIDTT